MVETVLAAGAVAAAVDGADAAVGWVADFDTVDSDFRATSVAASAVLELCDSDCAEAPRFDFLPDATVECLVSEVSVAASARFGGCSVVT